MKEGILLLSYGTIYTLDDVERYYRHILKGKELTKELLEELKEKYIKIGGKSPLNDISLSIAKKLQTELDKKYPNLYKVYLAFKHINPYIEEVVKQMEQDNITESYAIILSPYYSNYNIKDYFERTKSEKIKFNYIYGYHLNEYLINGFKENIFKVLKSNNLKIDDKVLFLFSFHSLPYTILKQNDIYIIQIKEIVEKLVKEIGIIKYVIGYQSIPSYAKEKWLSPDILEIVEEIDNSIETVISCPIGFINDHLEVLYDIDIVLKENVLKKGINFYRIELLNDNDIFIKCLISLIENEGVKNEK
jgi:ferrochelatase